jgi:hypothetical protein
MPRLLIRWGLPKFLPGLALNHNLPDICLPNSLDYSCDEPPCPDFFFLRNPSIFSLSITDWSNHSTLSLFLVTLFSRHYILLSRLSIDLLFGQFFFHFQNFNLIFSGFLYLLFFFHILHYLYFIQLFEFSLSSVSCLFASSLNWIHSTTSTSPP